MSRLSLLLKFENQSADYVTGFEAGQLWSKMELNLPIEKQIIHSVNLKQVQEMAIVKGYVLQQFSMMEETGTWIEISAIPSPLTTNVLKQILVLPLRVLQKGMNRLKYWGC